MSSHCPPDSDNSYPSDCQLLEEYRAQSRKHSSRNSAELQLIMAKAEPIKLLLLDVDGVLTDGSVIYAENGIETKAFNTQDGLGIRLVQKCGVDVGLITARSSQLVQRRAAELGMRYIRQGVDKKLEAYKAIMAEAGLQPFEVCYMGDDWIDLAILTRIGFAACPANSVSEVQDICRFVTRRSGGNGAVREVCDLIIRAKGRHDELLQHYLGSC